MRKELSIIMESSEKEVFFNIRRDVADDKRILLSFEGMKLSFDAAEMRQAISELNKFYQVQDEPVEIKPPKKKKVDVPVDNMFPVFED